MGLVEQGKNPTISPVADVWSKNGLAGYTAGKDENDTTEIQVAQNKKEGKKNKHQTPRQATEGTWQGDPNLR